MTEQNAAWQDGQESRPQRTRGIDEDRLLQVAFTVRAADPGSA
jgi:hypothetical protein